MKTSAVVLTVLLAACTNEERTVTIPEAPTQHSASYFDIPVGVQFETDLLIVVDNSPAMAQHIERAMPQLVDLIAGSAQRGDPDWHLGVITSDLGGPGCTERGDDGLFRSEGLVGAPFVIEWRHFDQRHTANYLGTLEETLTRLTAVGTSGCTRQQPLAAVRRALADQPRNGGFRRDGANLIVVMITASDDGSPEAVADHIAFLSGAAPEGRLTLAGIYDRPAARLDQMLAAFTHRGFHFDLSEEVLSAGWWLPSTGGGHWGVPCLEGTLGPTPECSISDVLVERDEQLYERVIPACDAGSTVKPCWKMEVDVQNCPTWNGSENRTLEIERRDYPPLGTHVRGNCVTL